MQAHPCKARLFFIHNRQRLSGASLLLIAAVGACSAAPNEEPDAAGNGDPARNDLASADPDALPPRASNARTGLCARRSGKTAIEASGLSLVVPADYVAIRATPDLGTETRRAGEWYRSDFETMSESGTACATASSNACAEKVSRHPPLTNANYCGQVCVEWSVVTTRGDQVERWTQPEEILALLGPIDTIDDAMMVVLSRGYSVECPPSTIPGYPREIAVDAQPVEGGFEVVAVRTIASCPAVVERYTLFVSKTGDVSERAVEEFPWPVCA